MELRFWTTHKAPGIEPNIYRFYMGVSCMCRMPSWLTVGVTWFSWMTNDCERSGLSWPVQVKQTTLRCINGCCHLGSSCMWFFLNGRPTGTLIPNIALIQCGSEPVTAATNDVIVRLGDNTLLDAHVDFARDWSAPTWTAGCLVWPYSGD
jgi:hypothetical protein